MVTAQNSSILEPLFSPWAEPTHHRVRVEGGPAKTVEGRRPSPIEVVNNLRAAVREWREAFYSGSHSDEVQ